MRAYDRSKKIERMVIHDHPCLYGVRGLCSHPRCLEAHFEFLDTSATLDDAFDAFTVMLNEVAEDRAYSIAHEDGGPNCPDFEGVVERTTVTETSKLLQSYRARLDAEIHQHSGGCYTKTLEARIAELEAALEPFAKIEVPAKASDGLWVAITQYCNMMVTAFMVRRARAALAKQEGE